MSEEMKFHEFLSIFAACIFFYLSFPDFLIFMTTILDFINANNGLAQVFVGLATIFFAYWVPNRFRKFDNIEKKKQDIFKFNEALVSHGVLVEGLIANIDRVMEVYKREAQIFDNMKAFGSPNPNNEALKCTYILTLMLPDVYGIISKIGNLGEDVHNIVMAYSRIIPHIKQYDFISEERGNLVKLLTTKSDDYVEADKVIAYNRWFIKKHTELSELTINLIRSAEIILDHSLYISPLLNVLSEIERDKFKNMTSESVSILGLDRMDVCEEFRLELRSIVDQIDGKGTRFLYFPS